MPESSKIGPMKVSFGASASFGGLTSDRSLSSNTTLLSL